MKCNYFNYKEFDGEYLLTNDLGKYAFVTRGTFDNLIKNDYESIPDNELCELKDKYFIYDDNDDVFIEKAIIPYRDIRNYLFSATSLHIFVLTNACNMGCIYCQAQDSDNRHKGKMSIEVAQKAVDIALQSPSRYLTFEFQGGEPLLNFEALRFIVEYAETEKKDHEIEFTVVTNTSLLDDENIEFFVSHNITVSTSLDGDETLHNKNRPLNSVQGSFAKVKNSVSRLQDRSIPVGAIQTTTKYSLKKAQTIIDTYVELGFRHLFIRPLTPLGYAKEHWNDIGYKSDEFIEFYKESLAYIIKLNQEGKNIREDHASIFLRKILGGCSDNYMELRSPCGAAVGQIAYYYDGQIFTCDEARMLAEMGMTDFCMGSVDSSYDQLMDSKVCKITCQSSVLESLPSCSDCVYSPYCGVCPVINYALEKNIYSREPNGYRCKVYKGILDILFDYIKNDPVAVEIFETWI